MKQPSAEAEHSRLSSGAGCKGGNSTGSFSATLPLGPLFWGEVFLCRVVRGQQCQRVSHEALGTIGKINHPQAVDRVIAGSAPQKHHSLTVLGDHDIAGFAEGEALGAGVLPRKRIRHCRRIDGSTEIVVGSGGSICQE